MGKIDSIGHETIYKDGAYHLQINISGDADLVKLIGDLQASGRLADRQRALNLIAEHHPDRFVPPPLYTKGGA